MPSASRTTRGAAGARERRPPNLSIHPATADRWKDLVALFGERGACAGCWCMWWRLPASDFNRGKGAGNRAALRRIVAAGRAPGLLAYDGDEPVGWCALAPRVEYVRLSRSRILAPVDETPVWSVTCFFVARPYRRRGVSAALLTAAAQYAAAQGATVLEGYPTELKGGRAPDVFVYTGLLPAFLQAGFTEVTRRSASRPIMRLHLSAPRRSAGRRSVRGRKQ